MKYSISFLVYLFSLQSGMAQLCESQRYVERIFEEITVTTDIVYGQVDPYDPTESDELVDIKLDFYEPVGDPLVQRPLVVMCFGGAFLFGQKDDSDMQAWCDSLAHRGYACASIDYRTGFNVTSERSATRAVYRAVQDLRAAIRFLKEDPNNVGFNVDPNWIFVGGQSAGAITSLHTAFLEESTERPVETFMASLPIFPGDNNDMGGFDESGNNYVQSIQIKGVISMWGAMDELDYMDQHERIPVLMVHGSEDPVVPYGTGRPFSSPTFPEVHGSSLMTLRLDELNIYNEFYPYPGDASHTVYGAPNVSFPNETWGPIFGHSQEFLYQLMSFDSSIPDGPTQVAGGEESSYNVFLSEDVTSYCWEVLGGEIINDGGTSIVVRWDDFSSIGKVILTEESCIGVVGTPSVLCVEKNILAIDLIDFDGQSSKDIIVLNWTGQADERAQGFVVEKSRDGQIFQDIADVEKKGSSNTLQHYVFHDMKPYEGINYFRLKMVDYDGGFEYSKVISVEFKPKEWSLQAVYSYSNQLVMNLETIADETFRIDIYNIKGQLLRSRKITTIAGNSSFDLGEINWNKGIYVLKIHSKLKNESCKFIL